MAQPPEGYNGRQVFLHWVVAVLFGVQFLFHDSIKHSWRSFLNNEQVLFSLGTLFHVLVGISVLLLALPRLYLRLSRGAPRQPEGDGARAARIAVATHLALYALIFLMPVSGMLAWIGQVKVAGLIHSLLSKLVITLVVLHVLGALYQHFIRRSDVLKRMIRPAE